MTRTSIDESLILRYILPITELLTTTVDQLSKSALHERCVWNSCPTPAAKESSEHLPFVHFITCSNYNDTQNSRRQKTTLLLGPSQRPPSCDKKEPFVHQLMKPGAIFSRHLTKAGQRRTIQIIHVEEEGAKEHILFRHKMHRVLHVFLLSCFDAALFIFKGAHCGTSASSKTFPEGGYYRSLVRCACLSDN